MNSPIDHGIRSIKEEIPYEILYLISDKTKPLEFSIKEDIIYDKVFPACNMTGGKVTQIILKQSWLKRHPENAFGLFEIPADARENRDIIEVHHITRKILTPGSLGSMDNIYPTVFSTPSSFKDQIGAIGVAADRMINSKTGYTPFPRDPIPEVLNGNLVMLHPSPLNFIPWCLTCRLQYDREMTNLNSSAVLNFTRLCVVVAKKHCYNTLIIKIDMGTIEYGVNITAIKDIISQWSNLDADYEEARRKFVATTIFDCRRLPGLLEHMV
jgi:hypothetical protein